jgi:predicted secreted hydrolase
MIARIAVLFWAFAVAGAPYAFSFPRDHAAHTAYENEWWYFTGHLRAADGREFGYELTFFRVGLRPGERPPRPGQSRWRGTQLFPADFAITDVRDGGFWFTRTFDREALGMGGAASDRLAVHAGSWSLRGEPERDARLERMQLRAARGGNALALTLDPLKPPAVHGSGGISRKGPCPSCASHYYSYTRLRTTGTLTYGGTSYAVTGTSWMDHEYGTRELAAGIVGWDWFSLQLTDGRELMLYVLRRRDGSAIPESSGSLIEKDGRVTHLSHAAFKVTVRGGTTWRSPHTGASYPALWEVVVPSAGLWLSLTPAVADQELTGGPGGVAYWEGAVDVREVASGGKQVGRGYVELTGYAAPVSL